ncbi:dienelactone hydrolase family protein [Oryzobacter telluris]|uniref:dienelactone hydrolase family protein n=1 Tax=Oryzobacter telluris TaxID=3149179 RepID=UPI00370D93BF
MTEVVLFHHVQGLTPGVHALADALRGAGHTVHTPDFFDGATYASIEEGFAAVQAKGGGPARDAWADAAVADLPDEVVYAGISLGVMSAQRLAQTRPGALGAVLLEAFVPPEAFDTPWPAGIPLQVHGMERDPFFGLEGDLDAAREAATASGDIELFVYPGEVHLFTDSSLPTFDEGATAQVVDRVLGLLGRV